MTPDTRGSALRQNWLHILVSLAEVDMHGSAIARDVLEQTEGELRLWPATLYRTLDDMVDVGLIMELSGDDFPEGESTRRRFYRITPSGRTELATAIERMATLAGTARKRLRKAHS